MIRIEIELDGVAAKVCGSVKRVVTKRRLGVLAAVSLLALPVATIAAPISLPHTFSAGQVISSSEVNANFTAVADGVNANDTAIGALETASTGQDMRIAALETAPALESCTYAHDTGAGASLSFRVPTCPAGKYAIAGGCLAGSGSVVENSFPDAPQPVNGDPWTTPIRWHCSFDASATTHKGWALCCAP